ncbi:family 78 glycoside hydrolase catalytic domain [Brachybacterium paraconglomeratum]|uniref:alpha-L-rhamnosidase n=1 Tax=Brachybacterium paraconglomeratum TaxID=173362 RepID=UPI0037CC9D72
MAVTVSPVRFEHHSDAIGIGESAPRLSWVVESAPPGWRPVGYEMERRDAGTAAVDGARSVLVEWPFEPLVSRERAEVRVRVTGADGTASPWSEWAAVEAGLLEADDWAAQWVGPLDDTVGSPLVRGVFQVRDVEIARARAYATARGVYELEVNGVRAGDQELAPGWSAYESRLRYQTYDITDALRAGENVLGAWLGDGWWRGYLGWDGRKALYGDQLGVLVQVEIEYADGQGQQVVSGPDWRSGTGPVRAADLYKGEQFDATAYDTAWSTPGVDESGWDGVTVSDLEASILVAPDGPPVRVIETLPVAEVLTLPSGRTLLDFGQNLVGRLRLRVQGAAGETVTLRHAEVLEHGELATEPLRGATATDTYTLRGGAVEEWAPRFTFHGFRYAEVTGWPGDLDPDCIVAEVMHSDLRRTGWFSASDPLVGRLHENIRWGMKGNVLDLPTDCPQRDERLGWTGDLQVFAPTAEFLYDSAGFLVSWLLDLAAEQTRYGGTPTVVPAPVIGYSGPMAAWGDAATIVPWTLYQAHGDLEVLARQFPSMASWVDEVTAAAGADHIWDSGFQYGDWLDPLAPPHRPEAAQTYPEIVATAYFARSARIVADSAALLGRTVEADRYGGLAEKVRAAFRREYVTGAGRLLSDSPTAYALALQFQLLTDSEQRRRAADRLAEIVRDNQYRISTGFVGTPLICDALSANGHLDAAYRLFLQTEGPSWLNTVTLGATTIWERWDSLLPDGTVNPSGMTSFNHYALGAVGDWMHRVVAGLDKAEPGYRRLRIAPQPPRRGLIDASARLRTPYGEASTAWSLAGGELRLSVTVPVGVTAEVVLPSGAVHDVEHGTHEWSEPFEVDPLVRAVVTVDTILGDIVDDPQAMAVLSGVISKHIPEAAEHMTTGLKGRADLTPRQLVGLLPRPDGVLADFERGFAAVSAGEEIPRDVISPAPE